MAQKEILVAEYFSKKELYNIFCSKLFSLVKEILSASEIKSHQITYRVKNGESVSEKVDRKNEKYLCIDDMTDVVGIRIITYYEDDVDKIANIIEEEFEIDRENSVDKRELEADRFGYRSMHYVISLNQSRLSLKENKMYKSLKAEIQIRSILQHAWAEIEHDIGYKGEIEIPRFAKRSFYRIAALLETADLEFLQRKESLKKYEAEVSKTIQKNPEEVLLDKASLQNYISESPLVRDIDKEILRIGKSALREYNVHPDYLKRLKYLNINSIKELETNLQKYKNVIPKFFKEFAANKKLVDLPSGISIFYLTYVLAIENKNIDLNDFCSYVIRNSNDEIPKRLIEAYSKLN